MGVFPKIKTNNSTYLSKTKCEDGHHWWVSFEFYPFAVGETTSVFEGRMYNEHGYWSQSKAVVKALNNDMGLESNLQHVVHASEKARILSHSFKTEFPHMKTLNFVMPCIAEMDSISIFNTPFRYLKGYEKQLAENEHVLLEEFIEGDFRTFVDEEGKICQNSDVINTFIHYSYVEYNGEFVFSNIEGVEKDGKKKLSSVLVHSRNQSFGPRDQGLLGINKVFKNHKCNNICKNWPTPTFGLVPSAPIMSGSKEFSFTNCQKGIPMYLSEQPTQPPPYSHVQSDILPQTDDRPLVHGH